MILVHFACFQNMRFYCVSMQFVYVCAFKLAFMGDRGVVQCYRPTAAQVSALRALLRGGPTATRGRQLLYKLFTFYKCLAEMPAFP